MGLANIHCMPYYRALPVLIVKIKCYAMLETLAAACHHGTKCVSVTIRNLWSCFQGPCAQAITQQRHLVTFVSFRELARAQVSLVFQWVCCLLAYV
eukprot:471587-Amphidinium_carterae.1